MRLIRKNAYWTMFLMVVLLAMVPGGGVPTNIPVAFAGGGSSCGGTNLSILVADAYGQNPRMIAQDGLQPVWSADGSKILYMETGRIHVVQADSAGDRFVMDPPENFTYGWTFTPDGSAFVYAGKADADIQYHLWRVSLNDGSRTELPIPAAGFSNGVFNPIYVGNTLYVLAKADGAGEADLYTWNNGVLTLAHDNIRDDSDFALANDGTIYLVELTTSGNRDIYRVNPVTLAETSVTTSTGKYGYFDSPSVGANGILYYAEYRLGEVESRIYRDGTQILTGYQPQISPDGSHLMYVTYNCNNAAFLQTWINHPWDGSVVTSQAASDFEIGVATNVTTTLQIQLLRADGRHVASNNTIQTGSSGTFCVWAAFGAHEPGGGCQEMPFFIWDELPKIGEGYQLVVRADGGGLTSTASASFTIVDGELPTISFVEEDPYVLESAGQVTLALKREGNTAITSTVDIVLGEGLATRGIDFTAATTQTLIFGQGQVNKTVKLTILQDTRVEGPESVVLFMVNAINANRGGKARSVITILDDDAAIPPEPVFGCQTGYHCVGLPMIRR